MSDAMRMPILVLVLLAFEFHGIFLILLNETEWNEMKLLLTSVILKFLRHWILLCWEIYCFNKEEWKNMRTMSRDYENKYIYFKGGNECSYNKGLDLYFGNPVFQLSNIAYNSVSAGIIACHIKLLRNHRIRLIPFKHWFSCSDLLILRRRRTLLELVLLN